MVAPPIAFGLSDDHRSAGVVISLRMNTLSILVKDVVLALSDQGFLEIITVNGHYTNAWTILHSINEVQLPKGTISFGMNYWDGLPQKQAADFFGMKAGMHAHHPETASVLAIDESLVDMDAAPNEWPAFPKMRTSVITILNTYFLSRPGSMANVTESGPWGDSTKATAADGEKLFELFTRATVNMIGDIEVTFRHFPGIELKK